MTVPPVMLKISLLGLEIIVLPTEKIMPGRGIIAPPVDKKIALGLWNQCPLSEIDEE